MRLKSLNNTTKHVLAGSLHDTKLKELFSECLYINCEMRDSKPQLYFYPKSPCKEDSDLNSILDHISIYLEEGIIKVKMIEPGLCVKDEHNTVYPQKFVWPFGFPKCYVR